MVTSLNLGRPYRGRRSRFDDSFDMGELLWLDADFVSAVLCALVLVVAALSHNRDAHHLEPAQFHESRHLVVAALTRHPIITE